MIRKFQLRGNGSVCAGAFQLLCGRAPAQLKGNIVPIVSLRTVSRISSEEIKLIRFPHIASRLFKNYTLLLGRAAGVRLYTDA
jgi:hypothetical protein